MTRSALAAKRPNPAASLVMARALIFFSYLGVQVALLLHAQSAPDFVFGFQMFNASSELRITLFRQLRSRGPRPPRLVPVKNGTWRARDSHGALHTFHWNDRVRDGVLGTLDRYVHASYGVDAQLFRLQYALNDVAKHSPDDSETERWVAQVDTRKNGHDSAQVRLTGARE